MTSNILGVYVENGKQNQLSHEKSIPWVIATSRLWMFVKLMVESSI